MSWFWYALAASLLWGLGYTINQATLKYFSPLELMFFESVVVCVMLIFYFLVLGGFPAFINKLLNLRALSLIIFSSIIYIAASLFIFKSVIASNASMAAVVESSYPLFTILFAFILLGEIQINLISACGILLIISGLIIIKLSTPT